VVVFLPPVIDRGPGFLHGGEGAGVIQQFFLKGLVPAFDLPGGGVGE
jgi:hypothetical protein